MNQFEWDTHPDNWPDEAKKLSLDFNSKYLRGDYSGSYVAEERIATTSTPDKQSKSKTLVEFWKCGDGMIRCTESGSNKIWCCECTASDILKCLFKIDKILRTA